MYSPSTVDSVRIGDYVEVTGAVSEFFGMTQLTVADAVGLKKLTEAAPEVKATGFALPADEAFRESLEGMLLTPQGPVTVADTYSLNQYGEIGLAGGTAPLEQPTAVAPYGSAEYTAAVAANAARGIKLDDGATSNFLKDATTKAQVLPYLTTADPVRVGAPVTFKTNVVLSYANNSWKFQPLTQLTAANAGTVQPAGFGATRSDAPAAVGGNLKIASLQCAELLPHHRRPARRLQVLHGPRRQPHHGQGRLQPPRRRQRRDLQAPAGQDRRRHHQVRRRRRVPHGGREFRTVRQEP